LFHSGNGGKDMGDGIKWLTGLEEAMGQAKTQDKCILLDFFNPD